MKRKTKAKKDSISRIVQTCQERQAYDDAMHKKRMSFLCDIPEEKLSPGIKRLKKVGEVLLSRGRELCTVLQLKYKFPDDAGSSLNAYPEFEARYEELKNVNVRSEYQLWYTEALAVIKLALPSRLDDFVGLYKYLAKCLMKRSNTKRSKLTKKKIRIEDVMRCKPEKLIALIGGNDVVDANWKICNELIETQCAILEAALASLTTSLSKIQLFTRIDLFGSELQAACDLCASGYFRAAGVMAGVVLKSYLANVGNFRSVVLQEEAPSLYDYAQKFKEKDIIDTQYWRHIRRLGDLYNRCLTEKDAAPTHEEIEELILGVAKIIATLF